MWNRIAKSGGAWPRRRLVLAGLGALLVAACGGKEKPASLPMTEAFNRMVPRTELVSFVVKDKERAAKVRAAHIEIEELIIDSRKRQARKMIALLAAGDEEPTDDEVRALFKAHRKDARGTVERYAEVQMRLRELTTADEFRRLNGLR